MPKMKSHSGAKKRFKTSATGKIKARHGMTSHLRVKKNSKRQRRIDSPAWVSHTDAPRVRQLLRHR